MCAMPPVVRVVATGVLAAALLAGCGGGSSSAKKNVGTTNAVGASQLAAAETPQFCSGLGVNGCSEVNTTVETWLADAHLQPTYAAGGLDLAVSGCLNCHMYEKSGVPPNRSKAPDLTHIGGSRSEAQILAVLRCPTCVKPGSTMPSYKTLPKQTLDQLAAFLAASH